MTQKLKMKTPDLTQANIDKIAQLFPNVITEIEGEDGKLKKGIDFDLLKQALSDVLVEDENERYRLDWPGKKKSLLKANTPINKTLRPCREESVNFDTTENLYIEGDNFEVLKILQESYLGKVKMIYIDPPYNTGNDFIYKDDFKLSKEEYEEELGAYDEEGGRLFKNTDSNGRFHSDWLSMMYERLIIARDLLKDDGVIFISIDDNEVHNLRKICDEIFGEENFKANFLWRKKTTTSNVKDAQISSLVDYTLCYSKSQQAVIKQRVTAVENRTYPEKDEMGDFRLTVIEKKDSGLYKRESMKYPILGHYPRSGKRWQIGEDTARALEEKKRFIWDGEKIKLKIYDYEDKDTFSAQPNLLLDRGTSEAGAKEVNDIIFNVPELFDNPKPSTLIKYFISVITSTQDVILDFFSGSATTAHAVMQLNSEDGGNRQFVMIQLPEKTEEKSEAYKAGYKTIADLGKERIRRAGKKILEELESKNQQLKLGEEAQDSRKLDVGFRVYKLDSTNMQDVYYHPNQVNQEQLALSISNVKEGRTAEDLLTQVILDLGLELNLPIELKNIQGNTVFFVQGNSLVACFDDSIDFGIVDEIAQSKPLTVVFKDAGFRDDKDRINLEERFKRLSPETEIRVI
jgi:adenine-specific DNA-methyltransferase